MISSRPAARVALCRTLRYASVPRHVHIRFQSQTTRSGGSTGPNTSHFVAGIAGGVVGAGVFYGIYSFTPAGRTASKVNKAAKEAEQRYQAAAKSLRQNTPSPDQAVKYIREFAYSYVGWIPGGRAYVDAAFDDWEKVRGNHREEADAIVADAYKKFQGVARSDLSLETASRAYDVLADLSEKIADLAGGAISDILDNHPRVKEELGEHVDELKQMGERYGPEAKKQVDRTWKQVKEIIAGGFSSDNIEKARKLIEEKAQQVRKLGDEAWKRGLDEAKPVLEKNPQVKEFVEKNADALKLGNAKEVFEKAKSAVESGNLGDLENHVSNAAGDTAKSKRPELSGGWGDLDKYFNMIPQGDEFLPKLQRLGQVAEKHREEGESLFKETLEELKQILDKKVEKAEEIVDKAKKETN